MKTLLCGIGAALALSLVETACLLILTVSAYREAAAAPIQVIPAGTTASNTLPGYPPSNVADGNYTTPWNAGESVPQWVQLDLGQTVALWKIRLLVHQYPYTGYTCHEIRTGEFEAALHLLTTLCGMTTSGQWIEYAGDGFGASRYVRVVTLSSPSWVAWGEIEVFQGVEYFGYFASAYDGHGTGDYTAETGQNGANLTWISTSTANLATKLSVAAANNMKAIVYLGHIFPAAHWNTGWPTFASIINSGHSNTVVGFALLDEPYLNAPGHFPGSPDPEEDMRIRLSTVASDVKDDFPTKAVAAILAPAVVGDPSYNSSHVAMLDWAGVDCYDTWANCEARFTTLRSWLASFDQRLIALPEAFRWSGAGAGYAEQYELVQRINDWHQELVLDGMYVIVAPFLWPSMDLEDPDADPETGARDLPWVKERLYQLSRDLLYPNESREYPADYVASHTWDAPHEPFAATNRNVADYWNAGRYPPASIDFDLGGSTRITRIDLRTVQNPAGITLHDVYYATQQGNWHWLTNFDGYTTDNQVLTWTGSRTVRWIRVQTVQSPSWVGWREVEIFKAPEPEVWLQLAVGMALLGALHRARRWRLLGRHCDVTNQAGQFPLAQLLP